MLPPDGAYQRSLRRGSLLVAIVGVIAVAIASLRNSVGQQPLASKGEANMRMLHEEHPDNAGRNCYGFKCSPLEANISHNHRPFLKPKSWDIACPSSGCSLDLCCDKSCRGFKCPPSRPFINVKDYNINCARLSSFDGSCTADMCCHPVPNTCMDHPCSQGFKPKPERWLIDCFVCSDKVCCNYDYAAAPPWAAKGVEIIFEGNKGTIQSLNPPQIRWHDIDAVNPVTDWMGIVPKGANWTAKYWPPPPLSTTFTVTSTSTSTEAALPPAATVYHFLGDGWCRPNGCGRGCRVNGFFKEPSGKDECRSTCDTTASCIGYAISPPTHAFPDTCYVYTSGGSVPSGWYADYHQHHQIGHTAGFDIGDAGVKCYKIVKASSTLGPGDVVTIPDTVFKENLHPAANTTASRTTILTTLTSTSTSMPSLWNGSGAGAYANVQSVEEAAEERDSTMEGDDAEEMDVQLACMLLGCVTFVMLLFSLVNYQDDDIRRYAWVCINGITSIFVAVLMFSSVNAWVLFYSQGCGMWMLCVVQCSHLFTWMCFIQLMLAYTSGVFCEVTHTRLMEEQWVRADYLRSDYGKSVTNVTAVRNRTGNKSVCFIRGLEVPVERKQPHFEARLTQMKSRGMLLAHMTGFAAINAGGTMQHLAVFAGSASMALVPVVINQLFIMLWFNALAAFRHKMAEDASVEGRVEQSKMFNAYVRESQNDICSLSWSFLFVQALRFKLVGMLPTMTGNTELPSMQAIGWLYLSGLICFIIFVVLIKVLAVIGTSPTSPEADDRCSSQMMLILISGLSMSFAWCFLFASRYLFESMDIFERFGCSIHTVLGRIVLALIMSFFCLIVIFMLDTIDDIFKNKLEPGAINPGAEIVSQTVGAISILAGFSWEHAFDGGVEAIAQRTSNPLWTATVLAGFVFLVIVPAWKKHILRKAMVLKAYKEAQEEAALKTKSDLITTP